MIKSETAWIREPEKYAAYVNRTTEKEILKQFLAGAYYQGELSIQPGDVGKKILDLGSGLGSLTGFLSALFSRHDIYAVERSKEFNSYAEAKTPNSGNITFYCRHFEDFSPVLFDFILCSHAMQYIDSRVDEFLLKLRDALTAEGEAWIIVQEEAGINQIVKTAIPFLNKKNPYFERWFVHDYVRKRLSELGISFQTTTFISAFKTIDFKNPNEQDRKCLDFILLDSYEEKNDVLIDQLSHLGKSITKNGYIVHEVGVTRIRRF